MELVERYLQAVKAALPGKQSDDIVQELRDSILSQVEERESTLGRPLNSSEIAEILKKMGNPMTLASRYGGRRQIIGGSLFTIYWKVLTWALTIALVAHAATSIAIAASGKPFGESLAVFFHFPGVALSLRLSPWSLLRSICWGQGFAPAITGIRSSCRRWSKNQPENQSSISSCSSSCRQFLAHGG